MKKQNVFYCNTCGSAFNKWLGQCPDCKSWNSITEQQNQFTGYAGKQQPVHILNTINCDTSPRLTTTISELDRVLGGGLVQGSVVLLGGAPGIGKSTVLLQAGCSISSQHTTLYISGEESLEQIALRARRLNLPTDQLRLMAETSVENILATAEQEKPAILIIDSIQTMRIDSLQAAPGSVSQVRESAARLTQFAKQTGTAIFLVGHVTKSGDLAGPRVLEHIIDVVCSIESSPDNRYRILRAVKNRFGAINELGVFAMTDHGMKEVRNPSAIFLSGQPQPLPGNSIVVLWEGSRPLLVEIQALVDDAYGENSRRVTMGIEQNRLIMLLAILHKHGRIATYNKDVFVNIVGGIKANETAADMAIIAAISSSLMGKPLPSDLIIFGEIGLAGEIRPVPNGQQRLQEAAKHGFKQAIIPKANDSKNFASKGIKISPVQHIGEALDILG